MNLIHIHMRAQSDDHILRFCKKLRTKSAKDARNRKWQRKSCWCEHSFRKSAWVLQKVMRLQVARAVNMKGFQCDLKWNTSMQGVLFRCSSFSLFALVTEEYDSGGCLFRSLTWCFNRFNCIMLFVLERYDRVEFVNDNWTTDTSVANHCTLSPLLS